MYINSNNSRKMHGIPLRRKHNKRKRFYTRCEEMRKNVLTYKQYDSYKDFLHALVTHDEEALKISSVVTSSGILEQNATIARYQILFIVRKLKKERR